MPTPVSNWVRSIDTRVKNVEENRIKLADLESKIKAARVEGALFHPTNPQEAWYCRKCCVFGKGGAECWSCGSVEIDMQWIPRVSGGSQSTGPFEEQTLVAD